MPSTTIHIPATLLEVVDARARSQGISRNRYLLRALERVIDEDQGWTPEFLNGLRRPLARGVSKALENLMDDVVKSRLSKRPIQL
jgi:hypothetical protein